MSWEIKDEFIDLALGQHVVVFHNPDVHAVQSGTGKTAPVEHHLIHHIKQPSCPTCGHTKRAEMDDHAAFHQVKQETQESLNAHHNEMMSYRAAHPKARLVNIPKR